VFMDSRPIFRIHFLHARTKYGFFSLSPDLGAQASPFPPARIVFVASFTTPPLLVTSVSSSLLWSFHRPSAFSSFSRSYTVSNTLLVISLILFSSFADLILFGCSLHRFSIILSPVGVLGDWKIGIAFTSSSLKPSLPRSAVVRPSSARRAPFLS